MLNYWFKYLFRLIHRYGVLILIGLCVGIVAGACLFWFNRNVFRSSISEGVVGTYTDRDLPRVVTSLVSRGLVKLNPDGTPVGDLAESWEIKNDSKEYLVKIRPNQKWLDGTEIVASDIEVSIPDVTSRVVDDLTLEFKLGDSFSPFMTLLDKPVLKKGTNIGTGPYRVVSKELSTVFLRKIELVSNDTSLPNVIIRFYPNEKTAKQALKIGEVQSILGINDYRDIVESKTFAVSDATNYERVVAVFYNTKDKVLSDENFRLALSYSAPEIVGENVAVSSIQPKSWAFNPRVKDYLDNMELAKTALGKVQNGRDETITLVTTTSLQSVGERVVEAWKRVGINATLQVESGIPQNFQALLIAQDIPADPDQYSLWHSTQSKTNISQIALPRLDKALEDGRKEVDFEKRKAIYNDFQKVLLDHAPAAFLYFPKTRVVYQAKVKNQLEKVLVFQTGSF
jgi:peptide/nickel transport system substrate-binding protein